MTTKCLLRHLRNIKVVQGILLWRHSQVVRQRSAKPPPPVQIRVPPSGFQPFRTIKNKQTGVNDIQSDIQSPSLHLNIRWVNPITLILSELS